MNFKKILFVCGSLEPGQDGVGDYTRVLACKLQELGLNVCIVSIMDRSVKKICRENQTIQGQELSVLRLGKSTSYGFRKKEYRNLVAEFSPDWVSLQYVPYAFSSKGIPFFLPVFLKIRISKIKWHFMVHEAYIWDRPNLKLKLVSNLQKFILAYLVRKLKPAVIHTSISSYRKLLNKIGIQSAILPLFGNIPIVNLPAKENSESEVKGVFFGSGPLHSSFQLFSDGLSNYLENSGKLLTLCFCGRPDFRTQDLIGHLKAEIANPNLQIKELGSLEASQLSELFHNSDFGISREPPGLMGKSGTVISMLEHGLPLWVPLAENRTEIEAKFDFCVENCFTVLDGTVTNRNYRLFEPRSRQKSVSEGFLTSLSEANASVPNNYANKI